jgi:hypothetical protein
MKNKEKLNADEKPATAVKYRVTGFGMIASLSMENLIIMYQSLKG